ncbi:hypothetical protein, partial [uncultured Microbacterium sp.]|uniref:hypothetical protein n=1 Tax=uncultured Microbacterium sp. TaxID=191216 RepID=UPI0025F8C43C
MTKKLIEEAAEEAERRWPSPNSGLYDGLISGFKLGAQWAFETAHTPTNDERPSGVREPNSPPDDTESDRDIQEAETLAEALFSISEKYD